ncbi:hypothetical protein DUGA2_54420 [Duganella sp. HH101]|nr:hypothetical protein DUGA2_54420 [Duganella sp. HH101]
MKGLPARELSAWISRAASSLPLPDSPLMAIGAIERASRSICARSAWITADSPFKRLAACAASGASPAGGSAFSRSADCTITRSWSSATGLEM